MGKEKDRVDYTKVQNLPLLFFERAAHYGEAPFLWSKQGDVWRSLSWAEVAEAVSGLSRGLRALGVQRGDRVGVVSENRPEWLIADLAIMAAGAITVPAYTTNTVKDHVHILSDSGAKTVIVSTAKLAERVLPAAVQSACDRVITMEPLADAPEQGVHVIEWADVMAKGAAQEDDVIAEAGRGRRDDTCCIIYTSGTGGDPRGVMLSHGAMLCNVMGAHDALAELPGYREGGEVFLSFLPLSHSYEHTCGQFFPIATGAQIYYAESVDKLVANISEVKPTIMPAVPRLYEAIRTRILRGVDSAGGVKAAMFRKAVELGSKHYRAPSSLTLFERLQNAVLERLVRQKVRERFGGRLKAFVSGGAPLNFEVGLFFTAVGLRVMQGYGQTEAAPVISVNRYRMNKLDTVGTPLKGVTVKIADDGEILVRGELVMNGYWNRPQETERTIKDGWLHTGDIGELDDDGFLRITDRKKDIIVNSGGDNVSPQRVEGILTLAPEIAQAMVYGDKRPYLVAIVVPDEEFVVHWARSHKKPNDLAQLVTDDAFRADLRHVIDQINEGLSVIEKVRNFALISEPFSVENAMLTPSMKIRRHIITKHYDEQIKGLYGS